MKILKRGLLIIIAVMAVCLINDSAYADTVEVNNSHFPNRYFRYYIRENYGVKDSNGKVTVDTDKVQNIYIDTTKTVDFRGIEYFTKLKKLEVISPKLKEIDLSKNTQLRSVCVDAEKLDNIIFPNDSKLEMVKIESSNLKKLNLKGVDRLISFMVYTDALEDIVLDEKAPLAYVYIVNANLEKLDISSYKQLKYVKLQGRGIKEIDFSTLEALKYVDIDLPDLESIKLGRSNKLTYLSVKAENADLDLSPTYGMPISNITIENSKLMDLDMKQYPKLRKINISKAKIPMLVTTRDNKVLEQVSVNDCSELRKIDLALNGDQYNIVIAGVPSLESVAIAKTGKVNLSITDCQNLNNLTLGDKTQIRKLYLLNLPNLKELNMDKLTTLNTIKISNTQLSALDVSKNQLLKVLSLRDCNLSKLDISRNSKLKKLDVRGNQELTELNLSGNRRLNYLNISNTGIEQISLKNCHSLDTINYYGSKIKSLDIDFTDAYTFEFEEIERDTIIDVSNIFPGGLRASKKNYCDEKGNWQEGENGVRYDNGKIIVSSSAKGHSALILKDFRNQYCIELDIKVK